MRKLTAQEIAEGAREFRTGTGDYRRDLLERQLNIEYATDAQGAETIVAARLTDRDGKVWEGSARGNEPFATLKSKAFRDLEAIIKKADLEAARRFVREREAGSVAGSKRRRDGLHWVSLIFSFPTGMIIKERDRNMRAGMKYGMDLCGDLGMYAEITDPAGRVWRATGGDMLEVNDAMRAQLETAAAAGDAGAKAVLEAIHGRHPPKEPSPESDKRGDGD